jgi:hypothetical protein
MCGDVGICLSLNTNVDKILRLFKNFTDFSYIVNSPYRLSSGGANGSVRLVKYKIEYDGIEFHSNCLLKSSIVVSTDNLAYEYAVGKYCINHLCKKFPVFVYTYGLYMTYINAVLAYNNPISKDLMKGFIPIKYPQNIPQICNHSNRLCLLNQFYNNLQQLATTISFCGIDFKLTLWRSKI